MAVGQKRSTVAHIVEILKKYPQIKQLYGHEWKTKYIVAATVALVAIALYGLFFTLSLGPVANLYTAESFPAGARSAAISVSLCAQFLAHAMVSFWFPVLMASRGAPAVLYSFAGICGVAGLFACTLAETKQASLEAIASELD